MNHSLEALFVFDHSILLLAKGKEVDAILREDQEVIGGQQEASNWWLPKLVALVPVLDKSCVKVNDENIEGVDADALVADDNRPGGFSCFWVSFL